MADMTETSSSDSASAAEPAVRARAARTYSSWMNLVERWFSEPTTKWLRRGAHTSVRDLKDSINAWTDNWNHNPRPLVWRKTRTKDSGH